MFKRILALFLSFVMVFSLLPVSAFAEENSGETPVTEGEQTEVNETEAPATEQTSATEESTEATESPEPGMTVISGTIPTQVNPRYAGLVSVEDIPAAEPVMLMTEPEYGTIAEAKAAIREGMKARAPQVVVYIQTVAQDFDALYTELFEGALAHTGMSTEGDYLAYQFGSYGGGYNGQYDDLGNYYMTYQFDFTYYDTAEQQAAMDSAVTSLLNQLNLYGKSDYEKICGIYDWMCANITYDNVNLNNESYVLKYTAYAALINRTSVCQGYANLFYRLALALDVDSRIIAGIGITDSGNGPHAWNIVKLNGSYYDMDATWDATWKQAGLAYEWFLKNEEDFSADHVRNAEYSTSAFHASYPMAETDFVYFGQEEFEAVLEYKDDYWWLMQDITINGDVTFDDGTLFLLAHNAPEGKHITIADGGSLTISGRSGIPIQSGGSITVENGGKLVVDTGNSLNMYNNGSLTVKSGGTLTATGATVFVNADCSMTVEPGATLTLDRVVTNSESAVNGVAVSKIRMTEVQVSSIDQMNAAIADYAAYEGLEMYTTENLVFVEDVTIPAKVLFALGYGATATVSEGVTLTNNGLIRISNNAELINNGTIDGTGSLDILKGGTFTDNSNAEPEVVSVSTAQELLDALADGEKAITIAADMEIGDDLQLQGTALEVTEDVTLTLNGGLNIGSGSSVTVSGELISNKGITVEGALTVENSLESNAPFWIVEGGEVTVNGTLNSNDVFHIGFGEKDAISSLFVSGTLNSYNYFNITAKGEVNVDGTFNNTGNAMSFGFVENHGTMTVSGTLNNETFLGISLDGVLNITGTYVSDGPIAVNAFNHDVQLSGVGAAADIRYCCNVNSLETLKAAVAEADNYGYLYIDICGSFDIGEEITFPANTEVHLYGQPENSVELRVLSAGRLTNLGKFYVEDFATLQIDEGAVYCNNADTVVCGGIVNVDGEYTSDNGKNTVEVDIFRGGSVSGVDAACNESAETFEELQSLLIAAKGMQFVQVRIEVRSTITLKNGLNVPPNVRLQIIGDPGNEVELIIPSGTSLSNHGTVEMNCGKLNIHSNGNVYNYGEFAFNAQPHGFGGGTIAGDFRNEGVLWINTGSSVTVAEGANLYNGKTLHVGFGENVCKLTVDGTVINTGYLNLEALGEMSVSGMMHNTNTQNSSSFVDLKGKLTVSGTLNNYSTIGVRGTLDIPGEVDNGGNMMVDGGRLNVTTYSGSGQITRLINVEGTSLTVPDNVFNVRYLYRVASLDELKAAIEEAFNYEWMEADVIASITLDADMEIPGGMGLNLCQVENQSVTLTVPAGMELTNRGSIAIHSTAKLDIQSGAALNNDSTINVQGGTLNNEGTYDPMDYGKINISMEDGGTVNNAPAQVYGLVFDMAGLKAALEAMKDLETDAVLEICGNVTVDTDLEIPANVTALIVGGPGMNLTVASGVTLVNNGCIEINGMASLVNDGALTNNGSMTVYPDCTFQNNGTFAGNKPIVYVDYGHVNVSTEAELIAGLNNENIWSMTITDSIRLTKNISIPEKGIYIDEGLSITVPEGVELNLNGGYIGIRNGNLLVEAGGLLINNGDIDVVRGELSVAADDGYQGDGQILQYLGRAVVSVPEGANLSYNAIAESAEELELILAAAEDMEWLDVQLFGGFAITDDLVIPANIGISMDGVDGEPAEYTVSGATLTSNGHIYVGEDAALVIEEDATLCNESGIYVAGLLDMAGTYISESDNVVQVNLLTGAANGVDFYYRSGTEEFEVLQELLQLAAQTELDVVIDISHAMDITEDIVIPENVSLELCNGSETVVNICESVTVTNNGRIAVLMGASLVNQGTVNNLGTLEIDSDSYLVDSGIIEGNPPVYGSAAGNTQVYTEEELLEALYDDSVDCVTLCAPVTLSGDLYVPDWKGIVIISEAALTVPDGKALYLGYGTMLTIAEGGSVLVSEGATLSNSGSIAVNGGSLIVNGEYVSEGELVVNLSFASSTVDGVDAQWVSYQISVENMAELKEAAEAAARMDNTCMIRMFTPFDITEDITISANTIVDVCLYDAENHSFLVAENVTIENFGSIRMNGMSDMSVLSGAEIINHGNLRIDAEEGGQLYLNDGASLTNKEGSGIDVWYGTLTVGENGFSAEEGSYVDMNMNYANVVGIEESQLQVHGDVNDATAFHVIMGAGYRGVSLSVMTDVTLECDVTVQEEDWVNMNEGATLTVPAGKTLTVDGGLAINADSAGIVEAGGKLVNNGYISADTGELNVMGTYSGEGTVHMYSVYGQINVSGIPKSSIDATFDYVTDVTTLIHALIAGYQCASVTITGNIVLTESLTVPYGSTLNIADYRTDMVLFARSAILRSIAPKSTCASLTVPEGMTLTVEGNLANNGNMIIEQTAELVNDESGMIENNGSLVVEEAASMVNEGNLYNYGSVVVETSAALVNNGSIETSSGTTLSVSGEYSGTGNVSADITDGTVVEGVDNDAIHMSGEANGEAALREMLSAGYNGGDIYVSGNITLTDDLTIPEGYTVYLNNGAVLNVPDENALTVEGHLQITGAAVVTVEGKLELGENGFLNVQNGELTVSENAECVFDDNIAHISGSGVINGLDKKDLILLAFTQDLDGFKQSMTDAANYGNALVYIEGEIVLTENTVIPQNVQVCLIGSDEAYAGLTIPAEITLTNNGSIEVAANSNLIIQDQGCIVNNGKLNLGAGSFVVEEGGILEGNGPAEEIVPVAVIGDAEYASVSEALACAVEGDTVVLVADVYEMDLIVREGITLDLNGHTLGAAYIFAVNGANIVDNSEGNTGLVSVEPDCVLISKKNAQLPVWNGEGYVFTTVTYKTRLMEHDNDKLKFAFLPQFKSGATALLEDGVDGNKVTIEVRVSWLTKMGREYRNLVFNEQQVDTVVGTNGAFILTFSGFSQLDMASGITVEGIVISETGVSIASDAIVVDVVSTTE